MFRANLIISNIWIQILCIFLFSILIAQWPLTLRIINNYIIYIAEKIYRLDFSDWYDSRKLLASHWSPFNNFNYVHVCAYIVLAFIDERLNTQPIPYPDSSIFMQFFFKRNIDSFSLLLLLKPVSFSGEKLNIGYLIKPSFTILTCRMFFFVP